MPGHCIYVHRKLDQVSVLFFKLELLHMLHTHKSLANLIQIGGGGDRDRGTQGLGWAIGSLLYFLADFILRACLNEKFTTGFQPPPPTLHLKITSMTSKRIVKIACNLTAPQQSALKMRDIDCRSLLRLQENFATRSKPRVQATVAVSFYQWCSRYM